MTEIKENRTLFVRNIPFYFTKEKLEDTFSEYGPIKECFIVNDRVTGKSRGFGFIKFTVLEDAKKVTENEVSLDGRKALVSFADISKKVRRPPRKQEKKEEDDVDDGHNDDDEESDREVHGVKQEKDKDGAHQKGQTLKYHKAKMVALTGLPASMTEGEVSNCVQKIGVKQLAECKLLTGGREAHLKFKCIRDAKKAIRKLHNHAYKDSMLQAVQLSKDTISQPQNVLKKSRVIVRNLSFQCTEEQLQKAFQHCGEITEAKIPANQAGKKLGFGFLQFTGLSDAKKAVEEMNTKKILGRPVAVDWALPKSRYESTQQKTEDSSSEDEGSFSAEGEVSSDDQKKPAVKRKQPGQQISDDEGVHNDDDDESDDASAENDDSEESDEEIDETKEENSSDSDSDDGDEEEDTDDSEESDEDDEFGEDDDLQKDSKKKLKNRVPVKSDTDDGCTLFLRNLSFDTLEEGLGEYFEQYGELKYAKVVCNPETEHSKGIGFVRFKTKSSADKCLSDAEEGKVSLDGRQLIVAVAVSREKASGFNEKKEKEKKDVRNLYLAREGMIRPGTQAAEGLSKTDLDKRMKVEDVKRQKLKNLDIFISPLRLCVRNIPVTVDDKKLREVFRSAAGDKNATVNECRIMRDRARTNAQGTGKSMAYGFVQFTDHQHALAALKHTNNNPDIFGDKKRLIVEFSLENRKALEAQEKRKAKIQAQMQKKQQEGGPVKVKARTKPSSIPLIELSEKDKKLKGDKVQKGLPSHWGPKIRHKPRPSQMGGGKKAKKQQQQKQAQNAQKRKSTDQQSQGPVQKKPRSKPGETFDDFDKIVNKYKNKLIAKKSAGKWFE